MGNNRLKQFVSITKSKRAVTPVFRQGQPLTPKLDPDHHYSANNGDTAGWDKVELLVYGLIRFNGFDAQATEMCGAQISPIPRGSCRPAPKPGPHADAAPADLGAAYRSISARQGAGDLPRRRA